MISGTAKRPTPPLAPAADAPSSVDVLVDQQHPPMSWNHITNEISFSLKAHFEDGESSQQHCILVEAKPRWKLDPSTLPQDATFLEAPFIQDHGDGTSTSYFQIMIDCSLHDPVLNVTLCPAIGEFDGQLRVARGVTQVNAGGTVSDTSSMLFGKTPPLKDPILVCANFMLNQESNTKAGEGEPDKPYSFTLALNSISGIPMVCDKNLQVIFSVAGPQGLFELGTHGDGTSWDYLASEDGQGQGDYIVSAVLAAGNSKMTIDATPLGNTNGMNGAHDASLAFDPLEIHPASGTLAAGAIDTIIQTTSGSAVSHIDFSVLNTESAYLKLLEFTPVDE